jgi:hypothetical protein
MDRIVVDDKNLALGFWNTTLSGFIFLGFFDDSIFFCEIQASVNDDAGKIRVLSFEQREREIYYYCLWPN